MLSYFQADNSITVNNSDLIINKWEDDHTFAEQQIAGIAPYTVKRLIAERK